MKTRIVALSVSTVAVLLFAFGYTYRLGYSHGSAEERLHWLLSYQVCYRSDLTTNTWRPFGEPVVGDGVTHRTYDAVPEEEPQRFYKILKTKN